MCYLNSKYIKINNVVTYKPTRGLGKKCFVKNLCLYFMYLLILHVT